jgi:hypothetical protein
MLNDPAPMFYNFPLRNAKGRRQMKAYRGLAVKL